MQILKMIDTNGSFVRTYIRILVIIANGRIYLSTKVKKKNHM